MRLLITGATGMIGRSIVKQCLKRDYQVHFLTTDVEKLNNFQGCRGFHWNPQKMEIDKDCLTGVDKIIHLAGAPISKRWTKTYKKQIVKSRVDTAQLLFDTLVKEKHQVSHFISASAIGIYPSSPDRLYDEDSPEVADDFLGRVVQDWEAAADQFKALDMAVAKIRIGLVLSQEGGFLKAIKTPISIFAGSCLGSGQQWQSWIHLKDLVSLFLFVAENNQVGVFNAVAPHPVKQKKIIKQVAHHLQRPVLLPPIPGVFLRMILGEMAVMVLSSQLIRSKRLDEKGFYFKYHHLSNALKDLYGTPAAQ